MARRGRFGRRPRSSPDLTATILAMAREYQNKKDQNVLNSWDKGGKFEGKQVTDQYLMDYLKGRRDGLAKDDPLYDEMSQKVDEYSFAIANSKQELKYAEHKVTDGAMSAFYKKWAAKLPENSEAWRNMMTLSAQYKDRAGSGGGGGGGRGSGGRGSSGYNSDANRIPLKKELAYDTIMSTLTDIARETGILNTDRETLQDLRTAEGDATRFTQLLNLLNNDPDFADDKAALTKYIQRYGNPGFNGQFTMDTINKEKVNKQNGIGHRIRLAQKAGHATDVKKLTTEQTTFGKEWATVTAAGTMAEYEQARLDYDTETADNPNATPLDTYLSMVKYRGRLEELHGPLAELSRLTGDKVAQARTGHLNNEISSLYGNDTKGPTLWEDSRGVVAAFKPEGGETTENSLVLSTLEKQMEKLATGEGVIVRVDGRGQPTDDPEAEYGMVLATAIGKGVAYVPATGQAPPTITLSNGKMLPTAPIMTAIMPTPIYTEGASGVDFAGRSNAIGRPTTNTNVANLFTMPDGTQLAQYWDAKGGVRWTNDVDGLLKGAKMTDTPDGKRVTVAVTERGGKSEYKPYDALDTSFTETPDLMPNTVGLTSYSTWLSSNRTATSDPGMAYAQDPQVTALAIAREVGTDDPLTLGLAIRDAEEARTDYLTGTSDIDRRIRAAAQQNRASPIADKAGIEGFADFDALGKDVADFYTRLTGRAHEDLTGDMESRRGRAGWQTDEYSERDAKVRDALMQDPTEAARILAIEEGKNPYQLPAHIMDLSAGQTKQVVGPSAPAVQPGQAGVVAGFKSVANSALKDVATALNKTFIGGPTSLGPSIVPRVELNPLGAPKPPPIPKPKPTPYIPPPSTPEPPPPPPRLTAIRGATGTHPGGGGPQEYN